MAGAGDMLALHDCGFSQHVLRLICQPISVLQARKLVQVLPVFEGTPDDCLSALAQATPRPAAPPPPPPQAAPQASQPPAAAPSIVQVKPEPSQTEWTKVCGKDPGNSKEICYTTRDFVSDQGQPVLAVAVYEVKGDPNKIVRFLMPLGLMLQPGVRFGVDQAQPTPGRYAICFPNGCRGQCEG